MLQFWIRITLTVFGFCIVWRIPILQLGGFTLFDFHSLGDYCSNMVTDDPLGSSHFCDLSIDLIDLDIFKHRCSLFQTHLTGKLLKIFWARVAEKQATWRVDAADSSGEGDIWVLC